MTENGGDTPSSFTDYDIRISSYLYLLYIYFLPSQGHGHLL